MRIYDASIAKFLTVDPLSSSYPHYSPYQFSGNNPVLFIDLDGAEPDKPGDEGQSAYYPDQKTGKLQHWSYFNGDWQPTLPEVTVGSDGSNIYQGDATYYEYAEKNGNVPGGQDNVNLQFQISAYTNNYTASPTYVNGQLSHYVIFYEYNYIKETGGLGTTTVPFLIVPPDRIEEFFNSPGRINQLSWAMEGDHLSAASYKMLEGNFTGGLFTAWKKEMSNPLNWYAGAKGFAIGISSAYRHLGFEAASKAQQAVINDVQLLTRAQQQKITTIVGGYNTSTGEVAVAIKYSGGEGCAEDIVVKMLGGNKDQILMTPAYRPRNGKLIPVCENCQTKYSQSQFAPGTKFKKK